MESHYQCRLRNGSFSSLRLNRRDEVPPMASSRGSRDHLAIGALWNPRLASPNEYCLKALCVTADEGQGCHYQV